MKAVDLRNMTTTELKAHHDGLIDELVNLRVKLALRQLDNPLRVRALRRDIARVNTIIRQKEGAGATAAPERKVKR
jgi:large subunit ribosomal protein L29